MIRLTTILLIVIFVPCVAKGQVDEIKSASAASSFKTRSSESTSGGSSSSGGSFFFDVLMFIPHWQKYKLHEENRQRYPLTVSLETMIQAGYKPKDDYFLWPRVRGNWGLFSTDFRMNYMFEKNDAGGYKQFHTNDWQVLQLNITTSRFLTLRVGAGTMTEAFGNFNQYTELTVGFGIHAPDQSNVFYAEYRDAYKSGVDVKARIEFNAQYQHRILNSGALKGYLTAGVVYQKYYSTVDFWGLQAGLAFKVY